MTFIMIIIINRDYKSDILPVFFSSEIRYNGKPYYS